MLYIKASYLVLLLGGRMSEIAIQSYTLFDIPVPAQPMVHVHPDASELNRVYRSTLGINVSPIAFAQALASLPAQQDPAWSGERDTLRASYLSRSEEHTSELQSLMRISYAVFCLNKKTQKCIHAY